MDVIGNARDRSLGSGVSRYVSLHGLVQHHAYHAGQIALLKKALASPLSIFSRVPSPTNVSNQ